MVHGRADSDPRRPHSGGQVHHRNTVRPPQCYWVRDVIHHGRSQRGVPGSFLSVVASFVSLLSVPWNETSCQWGLRWRFADCESDTCREGFSLTPGYQGPSSGHCVHQPGLLCWCAPPGGLPRCAPLWVFPKVCSPGVLPSGCVLQMWSPPSVLPRVCPLSPPPGPQSTSSCGVSHSRPL